MRLIDLTVLQGINWQVTKMRASGISDKVTLVRSKVVSKRDVYLSIWQLRS